MVEIGAIQCLEQGYIKAENYYNAVKSLNLYKLHTMKPYEAADVRGVWITGQTGAGKTHKA